MNQNFCLLHLTNEVVSYRGHKHIELMMARVLFCVSSGDESAGIALVSHECVGMLPVQHSFVP